MGRAHQGIITGPLNASKLCSIIDDMLIGRGLRIHHVSWESPASSTPKEQVELGAVHKVSLRQGEAGTMSLGRFRHPVAPLDQVCTR